MRIDSYLKLSYTLFVYFKGSEVKSLRYPVTVSGNDSAIEPLTTVLPAEVLNFLGSARLGRRRKRIDPEARKLWYTADPTGSKGLIRGSIIFLGFEDKVWKNPP